MEKTIRLFVSRRNSLLFAAAIFVLSVSLFIALRIPTTYYPYLVFQATEELRAPLKVFILQRGKPSAEECQAITRTLEAVVETCKFCKILENRCLDRLDADQKRLFEKNPVPFPVSQTPSSVISYIATDPIVSRAACELSEMEASKQGRAPKLTCYQPGIERPEYRVKESLWSQSAGLLRLFGQGFVFLAACFALMLLVRCLSAWHPTEGRRAPLADASIKISNVTKRFIDILLAATTLTVLAPVLALVAFLLFVLEGAPVFYVSRRFISTTQCVRVYKFRTMVRDASSPKYALKERFMRDGYLDIPPQCEVYTPFGRWLERTQLVEVLQLFNVLMDGMSLIGNRPLPADNIELLKRFRGWQRRFDCPAGITGIAQVVGKLNLSPEQRLELESLYSSVFTNPNGNILWCDLFIVIYTVRLLLFDKHLPFEDARDLLTRARGLVIEDHEIASSAAGPNS